MSDCIQRLTIQVAQTKVDLKESATKVSVTPKPVNLTVQNPKTTSVEVKLKGVGLQISVPGIQGPKGDPGETSQINFVKLSRGVLSALKAVRSFDDDHVVEATNNLTYEDAQVIGVTLTAASIAEQSVEIITFGEIVDNLFSGFALNAPIFLGANGVITQAAPAYGFFKEIGFCNGENSIFVDIKRTIEL